MGSYNLQENPQILKAKQLSQIAVDAVAAVRKAPGHENFKPPAYDTLLEISSAGCGQAVLDNQLCPS